MSDIGRISVSTSLQKKKTGLVLEGGAMRGMYTAGVLDVFMDNGITFDGVIGTSMGAITGCSYASGQKGRTIRYNKKYCKDKRYMSFYSLLNVKMSWWKALRLKTVLHGQFIRLCAEMWLSEE